MLLLTSFTVWFFYRIKYYWFDWFLTAKINSEINSERDSFVTLAMLTCWKLSGSFRQDNWPHTDDWTLVWKGKSAGIHRVKAEKRRLEAARTRNTEPTGWVGPCTPELTEPTEPGSRSTSGCSRFIFEQGGHLWVPHSDDIIMLSSHYLSTRSHVTSCYYIKRSF